jgi:hypothetical protein
MSYRAGLFHKGASKEIVEGVEVMLALAHKLVANQRSLAGVGMLPAPRSDQAEEGDED